jgi:hypothetical protein
MKARAGPGLDLSRWQVIVQISCKIRRRKACVSADGRCLGGKPVQDVAVVKPVSGFAQVSSAGVLFEVHHVRGVVRAPMLDRYDAWIDQLQAVEGAPDLILAAYAVGGSAALAVLV